MINVVWETGLLRLVIHVFDESGSGSSRSVRREDVPAFLEELRWHRVRNLIRHNMIARSPFSPGLQHVRHESDAALDQLDRECEKFIVAWIARPEPPVIQPQPLPEECHA